MSNADQSSPVHGLRVVRQAVCAEAGKNAEGEVEAADKDEGGKAHEAGRDAEVGDDPKGSWSE